MFAYACMPNPVLMSGALSIAAVQPQEIEAIRRWRNDQMDVLRQTEPIQPKDQRQYYETRIWPELGLPRPRQILLSIHESEHHIGYGGLVHISWPNLRAEISFLVDTAVTKDEARYAQLFRDYLGLIKTLAFRDLGLHRVCTETFSHRPMHLRILEESGFVFEGRLRNHVRVNEVPYDSILHGCLRDDSQ
jgi:RimJ/RimL family protein N-acetyltransferase